MVQLLATSLRDWERGSLAVGAAAAGGGGGGALAAGEAVPQDLAEYLAAAHPTRGPAMDEDADLDLLGRLGLRLSRSLASLTVAEQLEVLQILGVRSARGA